MALLDQESEAFLDLAGRPLEDFIDRVASFCERLFVGRPRGLWELGCATCVAKSSEYWVGH